MTTMNRIPAQMIRAWSENVTPSRTWAISQPMNADPTMAIPPIVGVPCFTMWCSGPWSSFPRIGWPCPRVRKKTMR